MQQIITAKYLVNPDAPPVESGALLCHDGKIIAVDTLAHIKRQYPEATVTDYPDAVLLPLFVNGHTHLELTDYPHWRKDKNLVEEPDNFIDWILQLIRIKKGLKESHYNNSLKNGIEQSLTAGTGAVGDILAHYGARATYSGTSLGGILYLETLGQDPAVIRRVKKGLLQTLDEPFEAQAALGVSPHSPYTISTTYLRQVYDLCRQRKLRCCTHVAESPDEVTFMSDSRGGLAERFYPSIGWQGFIPLPMRKRPVAYLHQQGGLFPENLLVHGVQLDDDEIGMLANHKMSLVLCPRSNAKLQVGKAPVEKLKNAGVKLVLGTDSLASNDSLSMWDEMAFAATWFAGVLDAPALLRMVTKSGADILGVGDQQGEIAPKKRAGFQVVRVPSEVKATDLSDYLVSGIEQDAIIQVYIDGQPLRSGL